MHFYYSHLLDRLQFCLNFFLFNVLASGCLMTAAYGQGKVQSSLFLVCLLTGSKHISQTLLQISALLQKHAPSWSKLSAGEAAVKPVRLLPDLHLAFIILYRCYVSMSVSPVVSLCICSQVQGVLDFSSRGHSGTFKEPNRLTGLINWK